VAGKPQDTFNEGMQKIGASGRGTHDEAKSVASDHARWILETTRLPVSQQGQEDLSLSR